ncbi:hypothetical protein CCACVL1_12697 [Corchorus capsularis]|uniref:Uncharacterized protein n=1 Tax=Corchorus capsularis TaxID=210143 RepID=A0A1R3IEC0_COCAP|nr:hypothetical protein CCACVL1_12697 [Corchorus capsularis]
MDAFLEEAAPSGICRRFDRVPLLVSELTVSKTLSFVISDGSYWFSLPLQHDQLLLASFFVCWPQLLLSLPSSDF